jgi:hypothetical protein
MSTRRVFAGNVCKATTLILPTNNQARTVGLGPYPDGSLLWADEWLAAI